MDAIRGAANGGRATFGSWISIGDPLSAEMMARAGFDWLILDAQHGGVNQGNLLSLIQASELGGTRALVRVSANEGAQIMRALDLGAAGVIVPMVSTPEQARDAVAPTRYPPYGNRSFGRVRNYYAAEGGAETAPLCFVMIETAEAIANLDAIAATPGLDGLFVGPIDLALSMGHGPSPNLAAPVVEAMGKVVAAARTHGIIAGAATMPDNAKEMLDLGMGFLSLGADAGFLRRGAASEIEKAMGWLGLV